MLSQASPGLIPPSVHRLRGSVGAKGSACRNGGPFPFAHILGFELGLYVRALTEASDGPRCRRCKQEQ